VIESQAVLFLKKKNQKNFYPFGGVATNRPVSTDPSGQKFFASFFQKRRRLPSLPGQAA
jgi:hypothetical protein